MKTELRFKLAAAASLSVVVFTLQAFGAHLPMRGHEWGGGDPVMMIFDSARTNSVHILNEISETDLPGDEWFKTHRLEMKTNLQNTVFSWSDDPNASATCALSRPGPPPLTIRLFFSKCRSIIMLTGYGEAEAIKTLLHEAVHQAGVPGNHGTQSGNDEGERYATALAEKIYSTWKLKRERRVPFWGEIAVSALTPSPRSRFGTAVSLDGDGTWGDLFIWGGCKASIFPGSGKCGPYLNDGAVYHFLAADPRQGEWRPMATEGAPSERRDATVNVVQLPGEERQRGLILHGGCTGEGGVCETVNNDAYFYDASSKAGPWKRLPDAVTPRTAHTAVWGDRALYLWGGLKSKGVQGSEVPLNEGEVLLFDETDGNREPLWMPLRSKLQRTLKGRFNHSSYWTGSSLLVWGGCANMRLEYCDDPQMDGFVYTPDLKDPSKDRWNYIEAPSFLEARKETATVWTGRHLIIWGGLVRGRAVMDGALYDVETNQWSALSQLAIPGELGRFGHRGIWDGTRQRALFWGGETMADSSPGSSYVFATKLLSLNFDRSGQTYWQEITLPNTPTGVTLHSLASNFDMGLTWGGFSSQRMFTNRGYIFFP